MADLLRAHHQWSSRPADQTYPSVQALHDACDERYRSSARSKVTIADLRVTVDDGEISLVGKTAAPAALTHYSFGQLCARAQAPASFLRRQPATLAAQNLNWGLAQVREEEPEKEGSLLLARNGVPRVRALNGLGYARIWDADITSRLLRMTEAGNWKLPMAYDRHQGTRGAADAAGMVPRGAYASDHDMFCFMVDEQRKVAVPGSPEGINRGFFVWNSEVGAASFGFCAFLYDYVCGNHIVWNAREISEIRVRHVGEAAPRAFGELAVSLTKYANASTNDMEGKIVAAQRMILGTTKGQVLDALMGKRLPGVTRTVLDAAYTLAEETPRYGDPKSVWGLVQGLTEASQESGHTDSRVELDRSAGKILEMAF